MGVRSAVRSALAARLARTGGASPLAVALLALAALGVVIGLARPAAPATVSTAAASAPPATPVGGAPPPDGVGSIPVLGDPVAALTAWYADRIGDANRAALANLRGRTLTPLDPVGDPPTMTLYGAVVAITVPILVLGGLALGYLVMTGAGGEGTEYTVRSITPRFVAGTVVALLGVYLVSVLAQFTAALDAAVVGVALPAGSVGPPAAWPAGGGVFEVLARGGFDPSAAQGPGNWNDGAWLSAGMVDAVLATLLAMGVWVLAGVELLLVLVGPLCLAAYALTATEAGHAAVAPGAGGDVPRALRLDGHLRAVQPPGRVAPGALGGAAHGRRHERPARAGGRGARADARDAGRARAARARGRRAGGVAVDPGRAPRGRAGAGRVNDRGRVEVPENAVRTEPIAFGLSAVQLLLCGAGVLLAAGLNALPAVAAGEARAGRGPGGAGGARRRAADRRRARVPLGRPRRPVRAEPEGLGGRAARRQQGASKRARSRRHARGERGDSGR